VGSAGRPATSAVTSAPVTASETVTVTSTSSVVPTATVIVTGTVVITPTTAFTLTPAVKATPTPGPEARLQAGRWLQTIGDCDGARREFAALVAETSAITGTGASEARYRLAQCYLADDAPTEADRVLTELLAEAGPDTPYRVPAYFLLGDAQTALGLWDRAEVNYSEHLKLAPDVASYTWQRIAATRKAADNLPGAIQAYNKALETSSEWSNTVAIRRALAGILMQQGDGRGAAAQYDLLRGDKVSGAWAAEMQWLAGSALKDAGDLNGATQRWQAAVKADATGPYAHYALVALIDEKVPVDEFQRGLIDYYNDVYQLAIDAFDRLRAVDSTGNQGAAWYYTGLSYLALGRYDRASVELGNFIAAYPQSPLWNDAWLARARALALAGDEASAVASYHQFAEKHPDAPQAPLALWQAANLLAGAGVQAEAAQVYLELARAYPKSDQAWRAYMAAGLSYFQTGDYRQSGIVWRDMAENERLDAWARAVGYYWLGRAQEAAGESAAARDSWQLAATTAPETYYSQRAASRLNSGGADLFSAGSLLFPTEASLTVDRQALADWLHTWAGEGSLEISATLQSDADWRRGEHLLALGLRAPAVAAWQQVQQRAAKAPWTLSALALATRDAGENALSITSAEQLAVLAPDGARKDLPLALQRLMYPLPFTALIQEQAQRWGVDPLLVAAVIRQESRFESVATSQAAAQGLMQVIPDTAAWIAAQLGWRSFTPAQIYRPYVNVEFGTYYLHRNLEDFDNSTATALAAYNGGPGNASTWRKRSPNDEDLMVALIDLPESRLYVQLVWQHYEAYRKAYPR
jgi:soluble lytic murein transglycosylase